MYYRLTSQAAQVNLYSLMVRYSLANSRGSMWGIGLITSAHSSRLNKSVRTVHTEIIFLKLQGYRNLTQAKVNNIV